MGSGVEFMAEKGREYKADWHGKSPSAEERGGIEVHRTFSG